MSATSLETKQRPWRLTLAIIFGIILVANYSVPGAGLALIWAAAVMALLGGIVMIFQAFCGRTA